MRTQLDIADARGHWPSACTRGRVAVTAVFCFLLFYFLLVAGSGTAHANPQTIVSLTFDDGTATQYQADQMLNAHGMHGTFFVNSSNIGTGDYMTWKQIGQLAHDGNEIGGHTAHHANLTQVDSAEARRQICQDRVNLINKGYDAKSFAYPYGAYNSNVKQMVQDCGYNSARAVDHATSESIPPADPYAIHEASGSNDVATLENAVMSAEQSGGGWVPLVFHQLCDSCDSSWIRPADLNAFLDWLQARQANGTVVQTVDQVIGGAAQPAVQPPPRPPAPNGYNGLRNSSLETDSNGDSVPDCSRPDNFGDHSYDWTRTSDAHSGSWAERVDVTNYTSGDSKLQVYDDLGFCTPTVTPGHTYKITAWYKSSAPVSFAAFTRNDVGSFDFWDSSPTFPASSTWTQATWTTNAIPDGTTGLSFGLALSSNGSLTVDDLGIDDASPTGSPDTTRPTVSLTAPSTNSTVAGSVPIQATASDNVAVDHIDYLVDGAVIGSSTNTPYSFNWNSRSAQNGIHTIAVRAVDTAGNTTTTSAVSVLVSNSVVNLLQNPSLETASGSTPSCWLLGGYGTNTFTWTRTSDAHTGSFGEKLDISSWTNGDRKLVNTQGTPGPCSVAGTPGHSYAVSAWYQSPLDSNPTGSQPSVFAYYRNAAGSWVYWTQSPKFPASSTWRQATWNTPALPAGATHVSIGMGLTTAGTVTMDDFSLSDNAPPPDTTPPTSSISCNGQVGDEAGGSGCISGYYNDSVEVSLTASDEQFGSGVASIRYTTDGSDPTQTNGTTYDGAFSVRSAGATVKWRAYDKAGNAEDVHTQVIRIDTTPPTSSITCNGGDCQNGWYAGAVSVALSATANGGSGVREIRYTTDGSDPTATNGQSYLGAFSVSETTTVKYRAYDNAGNAEPIQTQTVQIDTDAPTSTISCNGGPCSDQTYTSPVAVALDATDNIGGSGVSMIRYTTDGSDPTETNGNIYGPFTFTVDTTTTVKYRAFDYAGNAGPLNTQVIHVDTSGTPSVTLTSPTNGSTVSGTTNLTADASDAAITSVEFLVDDQSVGTIPQPPFNMAWDSTSVPDGTHTIAVHALDSDGNQIGSDSVTVTVANSTPDTTPPTSSVSCNGSMCSSGFYNTDVSVTLSATDDPGGSGVREIRYTTDGSDPTSTNGVVYTGSFSLGTTTTLKYRAFDNAGNAEPVNSQVIRTDRVSPNSSILCGSNPCSSSYYKSAPSVSLAASDAGGSGVAEIRYTTDGSDPSSTNGTVYSSPFTLNSTTSVKYRALDNAGNAEPVNSALIKVDTTPPATTISCNNGSCSGAFKPGASVSLAATDADSGVASIRYTTNGTDPTTSNGTVYTAPFTLSTTTTVKYRAFDNAGNAESVGSKQIQIDGTAPSASLTSPNAGDLVAGTTTLAANASDNLAVDHVDFLVDGQQVGTDSSAPYTFDWNSQSVSDGPHSISARAVDSAGNSTTSSSVSVTVTNNNLLKNSSLETATGSTPSCWLLGGYGTNTFTWTRTSDAHTGSFGEGLTISSLTNGDRKLVSTQDTGSCAPNATPGKTYTVTAWYKSSDGPEFFAYYRNSSGSWVYWTQSPKAPAATSWTRRTWTTPAVPAGATNISVGMGLVNTGSVTLDDFGLFGNG